MTSGEITTPPTCHVRSREKSVDRFANHGRQSHARRGVGHVPAHYTWRPGPRREATFTVSDGHYSVTLAAGIHDIRVTRDETPGLEVPAYGRIRPRYPRDCRD